MQTLSKELEQNEYDALMKTLPEKRILPSGDVLYDKIVGILLAYTVLYRSREWVDHITVSDAVDEIKQLIEDETTKELD